MYVELYLCHNQNVCMCTIVCKSFAPKNKLQQGMKTRYLRTLGSPWQELSFAGRQLREKTGEAYRLSPGCRPAFNYQPRCTEGRCWKLGRLSQSMAKGRGFQKEASKQSHSRLGRRFQLEDWKNSKGYFYPSRMMEESRFKSESKWGRINEIRAQES